MVEDQLVKRGISDPAVLAAMGAVPRHLFVPPALQRRAYADCALGIGHGQTISQPYMVALMTELLHLASNSRLLEVGTGSGYQAAVAARIASEVWSIERVPELSQRAAAVLASLGVSNVHLRVGDGCRGLPEEAPFHAIVVTAAAPRVPPALTEQLAEGGRLVIPLGPEGRTQVLTVYERVGEELRIQRDVACRFVPLIGEGAHDAPDTLPQAPDAAHDEFGGPTNGDGRWLW
jgi:protein-L-isoaspartate(D-aspartate) O-methyltransferase